MKPATKIKDRTARGTSTMVSGALRRRYVAKQALIDLGQDPIWD